MGVILSAVKKTERWERTTTGRDSLQNERLEWYHVVKGEGECSFQMEGIQILADELSRQDRCVKALAEQMPKVM